MSDAAAASLDADSDVWPIVGRLLNTHPRHPFRLLVPRVSKWFLPGETIFQLPVDDDENEFVNIVAHAVEENEHRQPVLVLRIADRDVSDAAVEYISSLDADVTLLGQDMEGSDPSTATPSQALGLLYRFDAFTGDISNVDDLYKLLSVDPEDERLLLGRHSSLDDIDAAWNVFRTFLTVFHDRGRFLGIFGKDTQSQLQRSLLLDKVVVRLANAYKVVLSFCEFERSKSPDYVPSVANIFGFSSSFEGGGKKKDGCPEMFEELLSHACRKNLRRLGTVVYMQQTTDISKWVPATPLAVCSAAKEGLYGHEDLECKGDCMYGVAAADRWCFAYAKRICELKSRCCTSAMNNGGACFGCPCAFEDCKTHERSPLPKGFVRNVVFITQNEADASPQKPLWNRDIPDDEIVDEDNVGCKTWVPRMKFSKPQTIDDLVMEVLDARHGSNSTRWRTFAEKFVGNKSNCTQYLTSTNDASFPVHDPRPELYSFKNGMYNVKTNQFFEYKHAPVDWSSGLNFIPQYFDPLLTVQPIRDIKVPGYDSITDSQMYTDPSMVEDIRFWLDVFIGRLFFFLGDFDSWQKIIVLQGTGATGKSTIAKAIMRIFGERNVGQIPSNAEEQWALATVYDKIVYMCTEMKSNFKLSLSVLQNMISGDPVTVHAKFKDAYDLPAWKTHGLLIGNEIPTSWKCDVGGALERRVVVFQFQTKPGTQDPTIQQRFFDNLAPFLVRTTRTYMYAARKYPTSKFSFPKRMQEFQMSFAGETSAHRRFLEDPMNNFINLESVEEERVRAMHYALKDEGWDQGVISASWREVVRTLKDAKSGKTFGLLPGDDVRLYERERATLLEKFTIDITTVISKYNVWKKDLDKSLRTPDLNMSAIDQMCNDCGILRIDSKLYGIGLMA